MKCISKVTIKSLDLVDFLETIKEFPEDYEKFRLLADNVMFKKEVNQINY